jgi:glycosyltransferase involved in cell wall biosynthesis
MKQGTTKRLPISVCMISAAEASRIGRALESVADLASEIIVVLNADVADGTDDIAAKHGARVLREPWKGFVAQKNSAQAKASQPWVLGLDADEVVSPELREEIVALFAQKPPPCAAYSFPRRSFYFGRWIGHGDWYPDRCVRLWQRDRAHWMGVEPHAALKVDGTIGKLRHDLFHYTTDTLNHQVAKTVKYADAFVQHCAQTGQHITAADLLVRPAWRFVRAYFLKLGFLDGWQGYTIAWLTAFYTFLRYAKARQEQAGAFAEARGPRQAVL